MFIANGLYRECEGIIQECEGIIQDCRSCGVVFCFWIGVEDVVVRVWDLRDMTFFGLSNPKP